MMTMFMEGSPFNLLFYFNAKTQRRKELWVLGVALVQYFTGRYLYFFNFPETFTITVFSFPSTVSKVTFNDIPCFLVITKQKVDTRF
ncbi:MAG: hypothetical protein COA73_18075 [Candidatus Hydrogenedentota bacterium]|nr:MAG: hypothetical protein COA73_18075 [Candidatus Hydrogenedentota bacterium]